MGGSLPLALPLRSPPPSTLPLQTKLPWRELSRASLAPPRGEATAESCVLIHWSGILSAGPCRKFEFFYMCCRADRVRTFLCAGPTRQLGNLQTSNAKGRSIRTRELVIRTNPTPSRFAEKNSSALLWGGFDKLLASLTFPRPHTQDSDTFFWGDWVDIRRIIVLRGLGSHRFEPKPHAKSAYMSMQGPGLWVFQSRRLYVMA